MFKLLVTVLHELLDCLPELQQLWNLFQASNLAKAEYVLIPQMHLMYDIHVAEIFLAIFVAGFKPSIGNGRERGGDQILRSNKASTSRKLRNTIQRGLKVAPS